MMEKSISIIGVTLQIQVFTTLTDKTIGKITIFYLSYHHQNML